MSVVDTKGEPGPVPQPTGGAVAGEPRSTARRMAEVFFEN